MLEYLHTHQLPITFCDLKAATIMRRPDGQLMFVDFELACPSVSGCLDTVTLDTPGYAAPEQFANRWGQGAATLQSDRSSLGVIVHPLLSQEHPAKKPLAERCCFCPLPFVPEPLAALVASLLEREPERRIGSVQDV